MVPDRSLRTNVMRSPAATTGMVTPSTPTAPMVSPRLTTTVRLNSSRPKFRSEAASSNASTGAPKTTAATRRPLPPAAATRQCPARAVLPVFTPTAPGYSHSSGFRFSRWRAGPDGAGTSQNLVRTMAVNSGLA